MDIYTKVALVVRLRLETVDLSYKCACNDIVRLEGSDLRDPAVVDLLSSGEEFVRVYESVWGSREARAERASEH